MPGHANAFIWYDVMTTAPEAATSFYRDVIGWSARDSGVHGANYTLLSFGDAMVGGLMATPPEALAMGVPPCWTGYIGVPDVDAHVRRVLAAGGAERRAATDIPSVGRYAVVADPQGAVFILFTPAGIPQRPNIAPGAPGHVGWHELYAVDGATAFDFYHDMFGWTKSEAIDMGPMGTYQLFAAGGEPCGGMMTRPAEAPGPCWGYYFNVATINAAVARVHDAGGKVRHGPMQVPGGMWVAQCSDPQGAAFGMVASVA